MIMGAGAGEAEKGLLTSDPRSEQLSIIHQPHGEINEKRVCGSISAPRSCQFSQYGTRQLLSGCSGVRGHGGTSPTGSNQT